MYRFHISYRDNSLNDCFLRGANIIISYNDIVKAITDFYSKHENCEIVGIAVNSTN